MAPDAGFTNISDKNEFTKFTKFLAYKAVQVIVESRKGVKIMPNSKPQTSDTDWFNLQIPDSPEVNQATKNVLPSDRILETIKSQLHVEISVQTEDGDELVLELWTLLLDETQHDTTLKAMTTIYFRMGILLKSLITITRIAPAYKLSRIQDSESFTVFYRVYIGEPKEKTLGDSVRRSQVGMLKTPVGGLCFTVLYRTDFCISPNKSDKNKSLLLKSDHFEFSPKHVIYESKKKKEKDQPSKQDRPIDMNRLLRVAAFVDETLLQRAFDDFFAKMPLPKCRFIQRPKSPPVPKKPETKMPPSVPKTQPAPKPQPLTTAKKTMSLDLPPKKFAGMRGNNDPPLRLLHFPFADDHPILELAEFYKDLFNAPPLRLSEETKYDLHIPVPVVEEQKIDITKDLEDYEQSVQEFDDLLAEMYQSADWSV